MVKQADKIEKTNPLSPIYAALMMVGLFVVAYIISGEMFLGSPVKIKGALPIPAMAGSVAQMGQLDTKIPNPDTTQGAPKYLIVYYAQLAMAGGLWLALLALGYFIVAVIAGRDPEDSKGVPMPERHREKNSFRK
jgi:hypothetical protein